jgi:hypothetical protein
MRGGSSIGAKQLPSVATATAVPQRISNMPLPTQTHREAASLGHPQMSSALLQPSNR